MVSLRLPEERGALKLYLLSRTIPIVIVERYNEKHGSLH